MLLNFGIGEDSSEYHGQKQTNGSLNKSNQRTHLRHKHSGSNDPSLCALCKNSLEMVLMMGKVEGKRRRDDHWQDG